MKMGSVVGGGEPIRVGGRTRPPTATDSHAGTRRAAGGRCKSRAATRCCVEATASLSTSEPSTSHSAIQSGRQICQVAGEGPCHGEHNLRCATEGLRVTRLDRDDDGPPTMEQPSRRVIGP